MGISVIAEAIAVVACVKRIIENGFRSANKNSKTDPAIYVFTRFGNVDLKALTTRAH